jgi:RNA polymerase-binding transcription factor DksA
MATKKKTPAKKPAAKKAPAPKPAKAPAKPVAAAKPAPKAAAPAAKPAPAKGGKATSVADLKRLLLERKAAPKAIAFSLDEVREIAKKNEKQVESAAKNGKNGKPGATAKTNHLTTDLAKPHKPHHVKTASLADILGFNPAKGKKAPAAMVDEAEVPEKFRRYYRLLLELRNHVLVQLGEHTEETLLKSAKDDSGDLSGYGQHMADAGTDTFDRDFALSLVSNEQEALSEIEAAIKRIHAGTYGICETTQKPIAKERLLAVPFTRYSTEAKKEVERHSHRSIERGGLFGDGAEEEGGKISDGGDDE